MEKELATLQEEAAVYRRDLEECVEVCVETDSNVFCATNHNVVFDVEINSICGRDNCQKQSIVG